MSDEMHDTHDDAKPVTHGIARRDALKAMAAAAMVPMLPEPAAAPMAPAARAKMVSERRFSPATSAMLGIIVMSLVPR